MKKIPIIVFGVGGVGRALLRQLANGRSHFATRNQCQFNIVAVTDSRTWQWQADGLSDAQILAIVTAKEQGQPVGDKRPSELEIINHAHTTGLKNVIVVDVTAVAGLEPVINRGLELGYSFVMANKKAFAGSWETARHYFNHPHIRHESTVGGGQPVIATLRYLLDTNDPIYHIEGQMSGTLGFICQQLDQDVPFSHAVAEAKARGYTEPDPREDLSGMDVMRKVLILGRMAGWPLRTSDIYVESLYPDSMADLTITEFMTAVAELDGAMAQRVQQARAAGNVLRYVAEVEAGKGTVGLKAVPAGGTANLKYISFQTERYHDDHLLIGGKGAGVEMTAAGVVGDMLDLVRILG